MSNINLIRVLNASVTSPTLGESDLAKVTDGNVFSNYASISTSTQINVDLGKSCFFDKISIRCLSSTTPTGLTFSVSNDGSTYTTVSSTSSSYKMSTYSPSPTLQNSTGDQHFSSYMGKMYHLRYGASTQTSSNNKLHVYNPNTGSWTNFALGISVGSPSGFGVSTSSPYAFFSPGNGNSNFYKIDLNAQTVIPVTPMPQATASLSSNGSTEAYVVDNIRNRIYRYGMNSSNAYTFTCYDINKNTWTTLANNAIGTAWLVYYDKTDRVIQGGMNGNIYQYNPYTNTWSFLESVTAPSANWSISIRSGAIYSRKHDLIFLNTSAANTSGQPIQISAYDPSHSKFTGYKTVIYDTSFIPSANFLADPRVLSYDATNDVFYTGQDSITNATFSFKNVDLFSYYANVSGGPYRYVRVSLSSGNISELKVYANKSTLSMSDTDTYTYGILGEASTSKSILFTNNVGEASDVEVFIEPDGSEGSRYSQVSASGIEWVSHCANNDLANFVCIANNQNYDKSSCGSMCTLANGGDAALSGFTPSSASFGPVASGVQCTAEVRTVLPVGAINTDRSVKIGVEIKI